MFRLLCPVSFSGSYSLFWIFCGTAGGENGSILLNVKMIQPYGNEGIWIPKDGDDDIPIASTFSYHYYEFYKRELRALGLTEKENLSFESVFKECDRYWWKEVMEEEAEE